MSASEHGLKFRAHPEYRELDEHHERLKREGKHDSHEMREVTRKKAEITRKIFSKPK